MKFILSWIYLFYLFEIQIQNDDEIKLFPCIQDTGAPSLVLVNHPVLMADYFSFIDSILKTKARPDSCFTEYILVHANPWMMDSLANTDYYLMKEMGKDIQDTRKLEIMQKGDIILIPDVKQCLQIQDKLDSLWIDVNVPQYRLWIKKGDSTLFTFSIRVGQNRKRYLEIAKRKVSLKTNIGEGRILKAVKDPYFINPVDGRHFTTTKRDDGYITEMPIVPWLETEIEGIRNGHLIHPTTNLNTLNKAYSNGCIGLRESDAWYVYYHAPPGTRIKIRYDLDIINEYGDSIQLIDIYNRKRRLK